MASPHFPKCLPSAQVNHGFVRRDDGLLVTMLRKHPSDDSAFHGGEGVADGEKVQVIEEEPSNGFCLVMHTGTQTLTLTLTLT